MDLLICFLRFGGAFAALFCLTVTLIGCFVMFEHWRWTRKVLREDVLSMIQFTLWGCIGLIFFVVSFYRP